MNGEKTDHDHETSVGLPNGIINIPKSKKAAQYQHEDEEDTVTDYNVSCHRDPSVCQQDCFNSQLYEAV